MHGCSEGLFHVYVSVPLVLEYEATAKRHLEDLPISESDVEHVLDYICSIAYPQEIHFRWRPLLRDPNDEMVLEPAVAAGCDAIITFNQRDYRGAEMFNLRVMTPAELLREIGLAR